MLVMMEGTEHGLAYVIETRRDPDSCREDRSINGSMWGFAVVNHSAVTLNI